MSTSPVTVLGTRDRKMSKKDTGAALRNICPSVLRLPALQPPNCPLIPEKAPRPQLPVEHLCMKQIKEPSRGQTHPYVDIECGLLSGAGFYSLFALLAMAPSAKPYAGAPRVPRRASLLLKLVRSPLGSDLFLSLSVPQRGGAWGSVSLSLPQ